MMPTIVTEQAPVPPPAYYRAQARLGPALHIDALTLVRTLHLLALCRLAVRLAHRLTFPHSFSRRVKVESRVGPLPTALANGAIRARAFAIRVVHHLCVPDSLPTGRSFSNIARCSSLRRFLPS